MATLKSAILKNGKVVSDVEEAALLIATVYAELSGPFLRKRLTYLIWAIVVTTAGVGAVFWERPIGLAVMGVGGVLFAYGATLRCQAKVRSMRKVHWAAVHAPFEDGAILLDCSHVVGKETLTYPCLDDSGRLRSIHEQFVREVSDLPPVLARRDAVTIELSGDARETIYGDRFTLYHTESELRSLAESATDELSGQVERQADIRAFRADGGVVRFVQTQRASGNMGGSSPSLSLAKASAEETAAVTGDLDGVRGMAQSGELEGPELDEFLASMDETWSEAIAVMGETRDDTLARILLDFSSRIDKACSYAEYHWYCPRCHEELLRADVENYAYVGLETPAELPRFNPDARMRYDPENAAWRCPLCEQTISEGGGAVPLPEHRMLTELFGPIYDHLGTEHAVEWLEMLNSINDQKREYRNDEFTQLNEAFERHSRELSQTEDSLREVVAGIEADQNALRSFAELVEKYERMDAQRVETYVQEARKIQREIEQAALEKATAMNAYSERLLAQAKIEAERRAMLRNALEERRHQEQVDTVRAVGQQLSDDMRDVGAEVGQVGSNIETLTEETRKTNALVATQLPARAFKRPCFGLGRSAVEKGAARARRM